MTEPETIDYVTYGFTRLNCDHIPRYGDLYVNVYKGIFWIVLSEPTGSKGFWKMKIWNLTKNDIFEWEPGFRDEGYPSPVAFKRLEECEDK